MVRAQAGISVREFLLRAGVSNLYIEKGITTLFIDGKPVDDIDAACIRDGLTLSLSAAAPGLVGATMRRGGAYSSLRSTISYHEKPGMPGERPSTCMIRVKLFNAVLRDLGPSFFESGVYVKKEDLACFQEEIIKDLLSVDVERQGELAFIKLSHSGAELK